MLITKLFSRFFKCEGHANSAEDATDHRLDPKAQSPKANMAWKDEDQIWWDLPPLQSPGDLKEPSIRHGFEFSEDFDLVMDWRPIGVPSLEASDEALIDAVFSDTEQTWLDSNRLWPAAAGALVFGKSVSTPHREIEERKRNKE